MSAERVLLLGMAPSRSIDPALPFSGRSGRRLADLAGIPHADLPAAFALANLLPAWPGPRARSDVWDARAARAAARTARLAPATLFVGRAVADAFALRVPPLTWVPSGAGFRAWMPHPSGIVRWWNDPANAAAAGAFLRAAARLSAAELAAA